MTEPIEVRAPEPEPRRPSLNLTSRTHPSSTTTSTRAPAMAKLRHEAATNRIRAKEAEAKVAELEGAAARLAALEHAEVERIAAEQLHRRGRCLARRCRCPAGWYDEEFSQLQPDKVRDAVAALIEAEPYLGRPHSTADTTADRRLTRRCQPQR